jgi:hypothetical protein
MLSNQVTTFKSSSLSRFCSLYEDYEELLDDAGLAEPGRRASEPVGNNGDALSAFQQGGPGAAAPLMGVDEAVVRSILSTCEPLLLVADCF